MKVLSVSWTSEKDNTEITFSDAFIKARWIEKADVMRDCIAMLQAEYDQLIVSWPNSDEMLPTKKIRMNEV